MLEREDVVGRQVLGASPQGKNLLLELSDGLTLHCHLEMSGAWQVLSRDVAAQRHLWVAEKPERPPADLCLALLLESTLCACFTTRRLRWIQSGRLPAVDPLRTLGPDLLSPEFEAAAALTRLRSSPATAIGEALMKQSLMAGIGNVFKSEVLFLSGVHPLIPTSELSDARLLELIDRARRLLKRNVGRGPRRTRFSSRGGPPVWVYRRAGDGCLKCGTTVQMLRQGAQLRSTYFCPECQPH